MNYPPKTKKDLLDIIRCEKQIYFPRGGMLKHLIRHSKQASIFKALRAFRRYEFYALNARNSTSVLKRKIRSALILLTDRHRNKLSERAGIELSVGKTSPLIHIMHSGVIINGETGEGCIFHGNNVLGNKRSGEKQQVPRIGAHVDIGFGACVIGNVMIADDCVIGAGAVVVESFDVPGTVIAGVPARAIGRKGENDE